MSSTDGSEPRDVVVVGARISGAALAIGLARAGRSVTLIDRAGFPSDTLSTHVIQVSGVRCMQKLGVLERLEATGAPYLTAMLPLYDGISLGSVVEAHEDWPAGGLSIHRDLLDQILIDAAVAAGVDVRLRTTVTALHRGAGGRVAGVVTRAGGEAATIRARLVVGADGRNTKIGELVSARTYNVTANERFVYWADFTGASEAGPGAVHHYRDGAKLVQAVRSDSGRFTVMVTPDLAEFAAFKSGLPASFDAAVSQCEPLRPFLEQATRASPLTGTAWFPGYFRESAGPGWVLLGDAGHFKDPGVGQGISDALRQAEELTRRTTSTDLTDPVATDRTTRSWWRWRDRDASPMYWLASDLSKAGPLRPLERELLRCISADPVLRQRFVDEVLSHRASPYAVLTPRLALRAAAALQRRGETTLAGAVGLLVERVRLEAQRAWLLHRPRYAPVPRPAGRPRADAGRDTWIGDARLSQPNTATAPAAGNDPVLERL